MATRTLPREQPAAHLDLEMRCVNCGYDLRGLPVTGDCPECGCPVRVSRREDRLCEAPRNYLRRLRRGVNWLTICVAVSPLLNVLAVFGAVGALWLLTAPEPARDEPAADWRRRVAARLGMGAWVVVMGPALVVLVVAWVMGGVMQARAQWWMYDAPLIGAQAALALALVAAWSYLAILVDRVPAPEIAQQLRRLARTWIVGLSTIAAMGLAANLVVIFIVPWFYAAGGTWSPGVVMVIVVSAVGAVLVWLWGRTLRVLLQLRLLLRWVCDVKVGTPV